MIRGIPYNSRLIDLEDIKDPVIDVYADEIWETTHPQTGDVWMYMGAIYEDARKPILQELINRRFCKKEGGWENYIEKNNEDIHWVEVGNRKNKINILKRWLEYIYEDCFEERAIFFSFFGINLSKLKKQEFGEDQILNSIYNRFFRSMLEYSLKSFFKERVILRKIFHEIGSQEKHKYFPKHTIEVLKKEKGLNVLCSDIEFLPKSHRENEKSNIIQLCDVLMGIFKDIHVGPSEAAIRDKNEIFQSRTVQELFIKRVIKNPNNKNSSYGYSDRFKLSFFPNVSSEKDSIARKMDAFYLPDNIAWTYLEESRQKALF